MRKLISCLMICLLLLCCVLPAASAVSVAGKELESGYYVYVVQEDGTAMITRYKGQDITLDIPAELDGVSVTAIGPNAFQSNETFTEVIIPEGIIFLGDYAFQRSSELTTVRIPASLTEIGMNPFAGCGSLMDIEIAEGNPNLTMRKGALYSKNDARLVYYSMLNDAGTVTSAENQNVSQSPQTQCPPRGSSHGSP